MLNLWTQIFNMNTIRSIFLTWLFIHAAQCLLLAQDKRLISGSIIDAATKQPLPFAGISFKKQPVSAIANEDGKFSLSIPAEVTADTLMVKHLGYKVYFIDLPSIKNPFIIQLEPVVTQLSEIVITPKPPTYYIKMAMSKVNEHYANTPFQTEAYYREKITENKDVLKFNECVFRSYYPVTADTAKGQHQLLLYRQPENIREMKFMAKERKEREEKTYKKKPAHVQKRTGTDFVFRLGGPQSMLFYGAINQKNDDYLDSAKFNEYSYSFAKSTTYNSKELMVIDFKSKGKIGHLKKEGKIYIDLATNAVFKITGSGDFVIPIAYRSLMFLYGVSVPEISFKGEKEYVLINNRWYPARIQVYLKIKAANRHLFGTNEHADFEIERNFKVYQFKDQDISPVAPSKRYRHRSDINRRYTMIPVSRGRK